MTHHEVVRTNSGWHTRLVATNGNIIMSSEVYTRRRGAETAIAIAAEAFGVQMNRPPTHDWLPGHGALDRVLGVNAAGIVTTYDVRLVDERD